MTVDSMTQAGAQATGEDRVVRLGGWLFRRRSWLPVPIVVGLVAVPSPDRSPAVLWTGVIIAAAGEALRLWSVHHIGVVSRTRSDRLGPLIASGPFAYIRNPLYLGNIGLWLGFTLSTGLVWLAPIVLVLLAAEYHAIIRWEEKLLVTRMGDNYRTYLARVPRWFPRFGQVPRSGRPASAGVWRDTLYSERSTLIAVGLGYAILWLKS
jgi:protein-S-isoprenylcysteine O-methyltransferase Ste14